MPPKKQQPSKKQQQEKAKKVVEDKTFGLKNKKGAKAQKLIANIQKQTQNSIDRSKEFEAKKRREQKEKELKELGDIFKPVISKQKIEAGVDPKSILCVYFKNNLCTKGDKCKYSHNLQVEKKSAKKDIYTDTRDLKDKNEKELNDDEENDQELSEEAIRKFHICNYFLKAVEEDKFGWFWNCPNGDNCKYKHALPRGYKLKKDMKIEEKAKEQTLEELLERFNEWWAKFVKEREKDKPVVKKTEKKLTGKELFTFNPNMEAEGEDDGGVSIYDTIDIKNRKEEDNKQESNLNNVEIDEELFNADNIDDLDGELNDLENELGELSVN